MSIQEPRSLDQETANLYSRFVRPYTGEQMQLLKLNVEFTAGEKDWLQGSFGGKSYEVLDLLGGFGANLLGHNHPEILQVVAEFTQKKRVQQAQLSQRCGAAKLGQRLAQIAAPLLGEGAIAHLSNVGSEAVEVALKNALLKYEDRIQEWKSSWSGIHDQMAMGLLRASMEAQTEIAALPATEKKLRDFRIGKMARSYHGRTLGTIAVSDSPLAHYLPLEFMTSHTVILPVDNPTDLRWIGEQLTFNTPYPVITLGEMQIEWRKWNPLAAVLVEPVQGEGGIFEISHATAAELNHLAAESKAVLIADEIQCGLGRCGRFFASDVIGLQPDVLVLGKSLGGGWAKIAATVFSRTSYHRVLGRFGSTFAEDELSCRVALKTLQILERMDCENTARKLGESITQDLRKLQDEFPDVIRECRGRGLMFGIEFHPFNDNPSCMLKLFEANGISGYLLTSFLLHRHQLRVAPSMSNPRTLRIEPSLFYDANLNGKVIAALADLCRALRGGDFAYLTAHLLGENENGNLCQDFREHPRRPKFNRESADTKIAFIGHLMDLNHLPLFDASLQGIPLDRLTEWYKQGEGFFGPAAFDRVRIEGRSGRSCELHMIGIYESPQTLAAAIRGRKSSSLLPRVQEAIDLAKSLGCEIAGLGGLTSILAGNALLVDSKGMALTTGNSLTAAMTVAALAKAALLKGLDLQKSRVGIVGASGNIGRAYSDWAARNFAEIELFGSPGSEEKMAKLRNRLQAQSAARIETSSDLSRLGNCDVIVSMTNSGKAMIFPEHLSAKVKVVLDVAVPSDVHPSVRTAFPQTLVIEGGWVKVPGLKDFLIAGMDTPPGHTLACLAETVVLGLSGIRQHYSYGDIQPEKITEIYRLAAAEGFELGELRLPVHPPQFAPAHSGHRRESDLQF